MTEFTSKHGNRNVQGDKNISSEKILRKILAPECLLLKVDSTVILLVNLSGKLVNGLSGTVSKLEDDTIYVHISKKIKHAPQ